MSKNTFLDQDFQGEDFSNTVLPNGEYDNCTFVNCQFSNTDLSYNTFSECQFIDCDMANAAIKETAFRDVLFRNCKLLGWQFDECHSFLLSFHFDGCILNYASFYQLKLKKIFFKRCQLLEVDFTECDLSQARFDQCDLSGAVFNRTLLEKADLRTALNYSIDPANNQVKKAKFSLTGIAGLLDKYDISIE